MGATAYYSRSRREPGVVHTSAGKVGTVFRCVLLSVIFAVLHVRRGFRWVSKVFRAGGRRRRYNRRVRLTRWIACAAATVAAATLVAGAQAPQGSSWRDGDDIRALIEDAGALRPEFAAAAFLRISESPRITPSSRRELLEDAFNRAYGAQESYRRSSGLLIPPDSRQGAQLLAYDTGLTRISLQVRATQLLASVDPERARTLFEWIDLRPGAGTCDDLLVAAIDEYYSALSLVARTAYASNRADAVRFLELYLWRARLPNEMAAVARALQRFRPLTDEATYLEGVFRIILEGGVTDARGFSSANLDLVTRVADLQRADRAIGVPGWHLMEALRAYLLTHLTGPRCADSPTESMTPAAFNGALARLHADLDVNPIDSSTIRPSAMLGIGRIDRYWRTPESNQLHSELGRLYGTGRAPLPLGVRQTREWLEQAQRLLTELGQWHGTYEPSGRDHFYQKSALFTGLLDLTPQGSVRSRALRAFVEFLRHDDMDHDRRALWFAFVDRLLELARDADRREILATLENSGHPVLSLYARLERVMPRSGSSRRAPSS
jgi:hypothetical protein